ncbi:MAG: ASCH domain-containing protein [Oscillospiraceae bacterium]|nr:ASCH domain-containing protein [Oscillospiraceae bacterium]
MNQALTPEEFWEAFCDHNMDLNRDELYYDVWQFLDGKRGCDRLASLCLAGIKTATSSIYETFELDGMKVPEEGDYSIILDSEEVPLFIIKDTKVEIKKFSEIDAEFAEKEAEGDQTLEGWRKIHAKEFENKCGEYGIGFNDDTLILCEEFEVVFQ